MRVPFLDLRVQDKEVRDCYLHTIDRVLQHGRIVIGPEVGELEAALGNYNNCKYAVAVSSGTDALFLGLKTLGLGAGDEVITSAMSFVASANAIVMTGAQPILADINDDLNINPESICRLITSRTKAIMPVHYGGKICNMKAIKKIAAEHDLFVIEDASQAFGATQRGNYAGTFGDLGCISLNPMKVLAAIGEAGVILTNNEEYRNSLIELRYNGLKDRAYCTKVSLNCKPDTIQAAVLLERLKNIDRVIDRRREIAHCYLREIGRYVRCPVEDSHGRDVFYTFTVQTSERDALKAHLQERGIEVKIYHTVISAEPVYVDVKGETGRADIIYTNKLALPCHENMNNDQVQYVIESIQNFFEGT